MGSQMPIFETEAGKILFIHVPKTGGTTIANELQKHHACSYLSKGPEPGCPCSPQHYDAELLTKLFQEEDFRYVFMVTRHPVERMVSQFKWEKKFRPDTSPFSHWLDDSLRKARADPYYRDNHFRPQFEFECLGAEIFRLEEGLSNLFARLGTVTGTAYAEELCRDNAAPGEVVQIGPHDRALINDTYAQDLERYGYAPGPQAGGS